MSTTTTTKLPKVKIPTPLSALRQVDRLVAEGKWTQGAYRKGSADGIERFCLVGCVNHVLGLSPDLTHDSVVISEDLFPALAMDDLDGDTLHRIGVITEKMDRLRDAVIDALLDCANEVVKLSQTELRARILSSVEEEFADDLRDGRMTKENIAGEVETRLGEEAVFGQDEYTDLESWNDEGANNEDYVRAATRCAMKRVRGTSST